MRRLRDERGAVAIIVAAIMVPLLICTALVVDMGSAYVRKREAAERGRRRRTGHRARLRRRRLRQHHHHSKHFRPRQRRIRTGHRRADRRRQLRHGEHHAPSWTSRSRPSSESTTDVSATATATWGSPIGGTAQLPLAFSWCAFDAQTGGGVPTGTTPTTILLPKTDGTACSGPTGNPVPGGFAWLKADGTECTSTSGTAVDRTPSDPGRSVPTVCSAADLWRCKTRP